MKLVSSHVCTKGSFKSVTVQTNPLPDLAPLQRLQPLAGEIASHSGSRPAGGACKACRVCRVERRGSFTASYAEGAFH